MISFHSIIRRYPGGTAALDDVSLAVPRGQFCVVLGPSGAGKSTLLRAVNGLTALDSGSVVVDGSRVERRTLAAIRRRIGMVHQQFHLAPRLTVLDNVLAGALPDVPLWRAAAKWFPRDLSRKACRLLAEVGLGEEHLYRRASALSGGQQQRVAIARALMLDPVVLLADEPVASLDPRTSADVLALLRTASEARGVTVLCSLHQVDLAVRFANRVIGMRRGKVVFDGRPAAVESATLRELYGTAAPREPDHDVSPMDVSPMTMNPADPPGPRDAALEREHQAEMAAV